MTIPNERHVEILAEAMNMSVDAFRFLWSPEYDIKLSIALTAMQKVQELYDEDLIYYKGKVELLEATIASLRAELDEVRAHNEQLTGVKFSERVHAALHSQIASLNEEVERLKGIKQIRKKWVCNECNFPNLTDVIPEIEIEHELHSCINCGGFEFTLK